MDHAYDYPWELKLDFDHDPQLNLLGHISMKGGFLILREPSRVILSFVCH